MHIKVFAAHSIHPLAESLPGPDSNQTAAYKQTNHSTAHLYYRISKEKVSPHSPTCDFPHCFLLIFLFFSPPSDLARHTQEASTQHKYSCHVPAMPASLWAIIQASDITTQNHLLAFTPPPICQWPQYISAEAPQFSSVCVHKAGTCLLLLAK